jgi:protein misato
MLLEDSQPIRSRCLTVGLPRFHLSLLPMSKGATIKLAIHREALYNFCTRIHGPAHPLPDSFPPIPGDATGVTHFGSKSGIADTGILPTVESYSSISTSSAISTMFEDYATFTDNCINRRTSVALIDVSLDDLKDLANDLWTIHDNFSEDSSFGV